MNSASHHTERNLKAGYNAFQDVDQTSQHFKTKFQGVISFKMGDCIVFGLEVSLHWLYTSTGVSRMVCGTHLRLFCAQRRRYTIRRTRRLPRALGQRGAKNGPKI